MNWKLIVVGALVYYVAAMIIGMGVAGPLIHEGVLESTYDAHESFWRPELNEDPPNVGALMPNIGALMPRWLTVGFVIHLVIVAIFTCVSSSLGGVNAMAGLKYGIIVGVFGALYAAGWSGVFNLPDSIWFWWSTESIVLNGVGGAAMGWVGGKIAPGD